MMCCISSRVLLLLACSASAVLAQTAEAPPGAVANERQRIAEARARAAADFQAAAAACYQRFAVNSCLADARVAQRAVESGLRASEHVLDDADRRERALARTLAIQERREEMDGEQAQARRAQQAQAARDRAVQNEGEAASRAEQARQAPERAAAREQRQEGREQAQAQRAEQAAAAPAARARYESRQRAAAERRAQRARQESERRASRAAQSPGGAPLPATP